MIEMTIKIDNLLYNQDPETYCEIQQLAEGFNASFNGSNIIQANVFNVAENYTRQKGTPLEFLSYPISDKNLLAFSFLRSRRIFTWINASILRSEQLQAVGHELYYIIKLIEDGDGQLFKRGSILFKTPNANDDSKKIEAETFSRLLFVLPDTLIQQTRIFGIKAKNITFNDILTLMDLFAVPYETIIIRLYESSFIDKEQANNFLTYDPVKLQSYIEYTGKGRRWNTADPRNQMWGSLPEKLLFNANTELVSDSRLEEDQKDFERIKNMFTPSL